MICGRLAGTTVFYDFEGDLLTFIETAQPGAFNGADMNEHISVGVFAANKAKTPFIIPFD